MIAVVVSLVAILSVLGGVHLAWALGSTWPAANEGELARTVAGFRGIKAMPPRSASAAVGVCLGALAIFVLALGQAPNVTPSMAIAGIAVAMIFIGRGMIGFTQGWRRRTPEEPFATLDRRYYSPLCLLIGAGFLALSIGKLVL